MRLMILVAAAVLVSGCVTQATAPAFSFEAGKGYCITPGVKEFGYRADGTVISFEGVVELPEPCYNVTAEPSVAGKYVTVILKGERNEGTCIQCVGAVDFSGSMDVGKAGDYTFKVVYGKNLIFQSGMTLVGE